jgi:hypothetical protein
MLFGTIRITVTPDSFELPHGQCVMQQFKINTN